METASYTVLDLRRIRPPDDALRKTIDPERLGELADSMAAEGLHQPLGVRGPDDAGTYEIVWGHRRYLAALSLHWDTITARVFAVDYDGALARVSENLQRDDLSPLEEAHAVRGFLDRQHPVAAVARIFRRSRGWVEQRAALLTYPEDLQRAVHDGTLSLAVAHLLAEIDHDGYRAELLREAHRVGANSATAAVWVAHYQKDKDLLVRNHVTVDAFLTRKDEYKIVVRCEACERDTEITDTRTLRFCVRCVTQINATTRNGSDAPPS